MQSKVKLTKRQIKEDKFTAFMLKSKDEILEKWQFYVIGLAVVVLAVAAVFYYVNSRKTGHLDAGQKLAQAMLDYRSGNNQVAILALTQITDDYSGDDAAEQATFLLGRINYETKNYPEAIRYYELYLSTYRDDKLNRAAALAGVGACQENQGNYAEAATKYLAAIDEYPDGPLVADYNLAAMRAYLFQGDVAKARERLTILDEKFKGSGSTEEADRLFAEKGHS